MQNIPVDITQKIASGKQPTLFVVSSMLLLPLPVFLFVLGIFFEPMYLYLFWAISDPLILSYTIPALVVFSPLFYWVGKSFNTRRFFLEWLFCIFALLPIMMDFFFVRGVNPFFNNISDSFVPHGLFGIITSHLHLNFPASLYINYAFSIVIVAGSIWVIASVSRFGQNDKFLRVYKYAAVLDLFVLLLFGFYNYVVATGQEYKLYHAEAIDDCFSADVRALDDDPYLPYGGGPMPIGYDTEFFPLSNSARCVTVYAVQHRNEAFGYIACERIDDKTNFFKCVDFYIKNTGATDVCRYYAERIQQSMSLFNENYNAKRPCAPFQK